MCDRDNINGCTKVINDKLEHMKYNWVISYC